MTEPLLADTLATLRAWPALETGQAALAHAYLTLLHSTSRALWREHVPGHLTTSGVVLSPDRRHVLLVLHPRAGTWLPPGGHLEPGDETLKAAALREVEEETGVHGTSVLPVQLDAHPFTCSLGVPTRHLNISYAMLAPGTPGGELPITRISEESDDLRWWPVAALPQGPAAERVAAAVAAARTLAWP